MMPGRNAKIEYSEKNSQNNYKKYIGIIKEKLKTEGTSYGSLRWTRIIWL
jgi:hypothetical protein